MTRIDDIRERADLQFNRSYPPSRLAGDVLWLLDLVEGMKEAFTKTRNAFYGNGGWLQGFYENHEGFKAWYDEMKEADHWAVDVFNDLLREMEQSK